MLSKERTVNAPLIGHFLTNIASWNIFINSNNVYYRWSKEFLEAGKQRLVADIMLKNEVLKKSVLGLESTWEDE